MPVTGCCYVDFQKQCTCAMRRKITRNQRSLISLSGNL
jgi:hypothetical protein